METAYELGHLLREKDVRVDMYSGTLKIKNILSHADAIGTPTTVLVMDKDAIVVKDMLAQTQVECKSIEETLHHLQ